MSDECPTCGAGRNEETDALYAEIATLREKLAAVEGDRDAARANRRAADEEARLTMRDLVRLHARLDAERARADAAEARVRDSDAYLTREVEAHGLTLDRAIRAEAALSRARVPAGAALEASQVRSALLSGLDKGRAIKLLERVMVWASGVAFKSADGEQLIADIDAYLAAVPADPTTNEPAPGEGPTK